jgi:hypothetical protein
MITKFFRSPLHEHAEPAQRVLGAAQLAPDSAELAQLLRADPAPEVRAAAALRCADLAVLSAALEAESDADVRAALASALGKVVAETPDSAGARALLDAAHCTDAIRAEVARSTADAERRRIAVAGIHDEGVLVALALEAELAETRMAAAERVHAPDALRRLADGAKSKDRGVARLARRRVDAIDNRQGQEAEADVILAEMEALAYRPGAILTAAVELDRRWRALDLTGDTARLARRDAAHRILRERFDREQEEQRTRTRFERKLHEWIAALAPPTAHDVLATLRAEHAALRTEAQALGDDSALAELQQVEQRMAQWDLELQALLGAEALVLEAEQLAAGTFIDNADLPQRWQALPLAIRTPALTRRFEAALLMIEQRRLTQVRAVQQEAQAARARLHDLLHVGEQALAGGQLQAARAAYTEMQALKPAAAALSKPTLQRLGHLAQQLVEMERWEAFGQHTARVQLCERAEALVAQALGPAMDASKIAAEVQKLRNEWKALDQQHAGVPKSLWERFDRACEKAYAPAAQHFAQQAAQRKAARKQREAFIEAAAAHVPTLLGEPRDLRAIEHWLRDTERAWREGNLGSVEPGEWKKLDGRLKAALAPLRGELNAARDQAKAVRHQLIAEAAAVAAKATGREAPAQVKAIQTRWQEQAKAMPLPHREEQALWEQFRAACNAVFSARDHERKEEQNRKQAGRRELEGLCEQLEQLAQATETDDQAIRRTVRELQEQWTQKMRGADPALRGVEARFRKAKTAVDALLSKRAQSRSAAVWEALAAKERLCEELDALVLARVAAYEAAADEAAPASDAEEKSAAEESAAEESAAERWAALPALPTAWEQKMLARRDAALRALADSDAAYERAEQIERSAEARREALLEIEMQLNLEIAPDLQAQRLAVQVKKLRERFKSTPSGSNTATELLLAWCAQPGVADARDRQRSERVFASISRR